MDRVLLTGQEWISGPSSVEIAESVKQFAVKANPQSRLSSAELIRSDGLLDILGKETPLSQFIREELDTTRSLLNTTLSQLEIAQSQLVEVQSQLDTAQSQLNTTRSQLTITQSQLEIAQSQLVEVQSQLDTAQSQLNTTRSQLTITQSHLDAKKQENMQLQAKIYDLENKIKTPQNSQQLSSSLSSRIREQDKWGQLRYQPISSQRTNLFERSPPNLSSEAVSAFSPAHFRVSGSTVTRINSDGWTGCFTKPVSKGVHGLSISTTAQHVMIGVLDAAEYPARLTSAAWQSPRAAMIYLANGRPFSGGEDTANKTRITNSAPREGLEWSAEADLEKRTLHFFINGKQMPHYFINIPVPLVFAINAYFEDDQVEITFWGGLNKTESIFEGTWHSF
ncbi:hypothetical protein BLNAU_18461 [Blattamonas nauphoetae]|uniref:Uncharacterized protein n=1 Tax=Blattamonas nauphoetae TaxID=2049346 RepID=A0ABQ9X4C3_9EUKA|nr:hypothetical protein BLNAU_18461 [Blattamonas nauphoetae]